MLNRKLTPTFTYAFLDDTGDVITVQYETQYISKGNYVNDLLYVFHKGCNITHFFKSKSVSGILLDDTPMWLYNAIENHAKQIWSEKTAEPMQLITERYKTL